MSNLLITFQNYYALFYYTIALLYGPSLLTNIITDLTIPYISSLVYFLVDSLVQMALDLETKKISYLVYLHHTIPLILLSQIDPSRHLDISLFGLLLLTEVSSIFLTLKFFIDKYSPNPNIKTINRLLFALTFVVIRGIFCNVIFVLNVSLYFEAVSRLKFILVGGSLSMMTGLNFYWSCLIFRKIFSKSSGKDL